MRKSRLSQYKQDRLIEHFVAGTTARCAAELVQVNKNSSAYYFHRLRLIIYEHQKRFENTLFEGKIEVDESYFGGIRKGKRGRGAVGYLGQPLIKLLDLSKSNIIYYQVLNDVVSERYIKGHAIIPLCRNCVGYFRIIAVGEESRELANKEESEAANL